MVIQHSGGTASTLDDAVEVNFSGGSPQTVTVDGASYRVTFNADKSVKVEGVRDDATIAVYTADSFTSLDVYHQTGSGTFSSANSTFNLIGFGSSAIVNAPVHLALPITIIDSDGDIANSQIELLLTQSGQGIQDHSADVAGSTFTATSLTPHIIGSAFNDTLNGDAAANVLSGGEGNDIINGGGGNDFLSGGPGDDDLFGGAGDDILIGGAGSDDMRGDAGADTFVIGFDSGSDGIKDIIADYNYNDGDSVDLTALLSGSGATQANIGTLISVTDAGADTNIAIDGDVVATLTGYDHASPISILIDGEEFTIDL